jgi:16S rRNA processing protein RimM
VDGPVDGQPVAVGQVGKPLGTRGEVYVFADVDLAEPFEPGTAYQVVAGAAGPPPAGGRLVVAASRMHGDRLVVAFEGVGDREAAEALRGAVLQRPRSEVVLEEDVIWVADLLGRQVVDPDGALVGVVERVIDGHAHDYLVLARPDGGEAVVPLVPELVDHTSGEAIVLQPVQGLVDPDEAW